MVPVLRNEVRAGHAAATENDFRNRSPRRLFRPRIPPRRCLRELVFPVDALACVANVWRTEKIVETGRNSRRTLAITG